MSDLGRPMNWDRVAQMGISTVERLRFKRSTSQSAVPNSWISKIYLHLKSFKTIKHRENELSPADEVRRLNQPSNL